MPLERKYTNMEQEKTHTHSHYDYSFTTSMLYAFCNRELYLRNIRENPRSEIPRSGGANAFFEREKLTNSRPMPRWRKYTNMEEENLHSQSHYEYSFTTSLLYAFCKPKNVLKETSGRILAPSFQEAPVLVPSLSERNLEILGLCPGDESTQTWNKKRLTVNPNTDIHSPHQYSTQLNRYLY